MLTLKIKVKVTEHAQYSHSMENIIVYNSHNPHSFALAFNVFEMLTFQLFGQEIYIKVIKYNICNYAIWWQIPTSTKVKARILR